MPHVRSPFRLDTQRSAVLVIDLQEKLAPLIEASDSIARQINRLLDAAEILDVPTAATVQYPKGLGPLVDVLSGRFEAPEEKLDFSAAVCRESLDRWARDGRDQIVIVGIETHVCVQQTVLDLLAEGQRPFVVVDAVAARGQQDHVVALGRMDSLGATLTTVEACLFEWLATADRSEFKAVSKLIQQ
ncbi:MAG: isochorismatase family protein [Pirellulaceae bacterium]|nr:isochorismatase family protein [Pirellulaceae bacterium]